MRVSINWIKRLLGTADLGLAPRELQAQLSVRVAEIETDLDVTGAALDGVVVGRVLTCGPHPGADKLRITSVDIGAIAPLRIVCGAPNVTAGQTVAVATVGATVSVAGRDGTRSRITIKPVVLRGEASEGMLCAEDELELGGGHDGILVLDATLRVGTPLRDALAIGDTVMVIENHAITHRPDLWGQLGWAREIAAMRGLPAPAEPDIRQHQAPSPWSALLADDGCSAYVGAVVEGVHNGASPAWMQALLSSVGIRPLGLLVDVTNLVMLELGEPMHAFDLRALDGTRIVVRSAAPGEPLTILDGRVLSLDPADLVVADQRQALALAGVMGGAASMVRADTTTVLLEAALFRPERIRRTRKRVGIATDSSARFEKGLYPELSPAAMNRAIALLAELCPGCRVSHRFASGTLAGAERRIDLAADQVQRLTGLALPWQRQVELLSRLGFTDVAGQISVPWYRRKDVSVAADLVEEVARSHGYEHIVPETPRLPASAPVRNALRAGEHRCRRLMSSLGWDEVATYAFTSQAWIDLLAPEAIPIHLAHPLSSDQNVLRPTLLPNLLQAVAANLKHQRSLAIYEIGKRYGESLNRTNPGLTAHEEVVICGMTSHPADQAPVFAARDAATALLRELGYPAAGQPAAPQELTGLRWVTPDRTVRLVHAGPSGHSEALPAIGLVTEVPKTLRERAGCPHRVGYFEIDLERLLANSPPPTPYRTPSRFPVVERQFTWDCPEAFTFSELETPMRQAVGALYAGIALDSIYRGEQLAAGRKAVSLRIFLQSHERTLEDKDLQQVQARIIASIEKRTPARLRQ